MNYTYDGEVPPPWDDDAPEDNPSEPTGGDADETPAARVVLTPASSIRPRPVFWLWEARLALGTLALLAGREGLGKSTLAYWLVARITRGELPGIFAGTPKSVLVAATEDSWEHTIVPRLIAASADLDRVFRVEVINVLGVHVGLSLPRDIPALSHQSVQVDAALLLLDPLMSRLGALDTHRDAEVRQALEPLVTVADRANLSVLGLIHHNKSGSSDPLQLVMGSKAFTAVARSVHTVVPDPDDETEERRLFGTPKNNLGRTGLPTLSFTIVSHPVDTDEGVAWTGRLEWGEDSSVSIGDAMRQAASDDDRSAASEATGWLNDYLESQGGKALSSAVKKAGKSAGHSERALRNARKRLRLCTPSEGYPRVTWWVLPVVTPSRDASLRGDVTTDMTDTTRADLHSRVSRDSRDALQNTVSRLCPDCGSQLLPGRVRCGPCGHRHLMAARIEAKS